LREISRERGELRQAEGRLDAARNEFKNDLRNR
jgi:hypothetical protein